MWHFIESHMWSVLFTTSIADVQSRYGLEVLPLLKEWLENTLNSDDWYFDIHRSAHLFFTDEATATLCYMRFRG